jgi:hypothetical protein
MILELKHEGSSGYGEATEILYYGKNLEKMVQLVLDHKSWIESMDIIPPGARYKELLKMFGQDHLSCVLGWAITICGNSRKEID